MPSITAAVAVYNGAETIARALDSIFAQTRHPDEILVLDDGSTDRTAEIVGSYSGVRLLRQVNAGIGAARQRLLTECQSDWIAFCDHDDAWRPRKLEIQAASIEPGLALIHTRTLVHRGSEEFRRGHSPKGGSVWDHLLPDNLIQTSTALVNCTALRDTGGFPTDSSRAEDYAAWIRLSDWGDFLHLPEVLVDMYERTGSASTPNAAWYAAEEEVLRREAIPRLPSGYEGVLRRKLSVIDSLRAEALDAERRPKEARTLHLRSLRHRPLSPGAWRRFLRHLSRRP